ncbi:hypothetical protein [Bradyrhizobium lablabi]|nr:hypothetical protein [Bradyrhizobium lablabi]MBR0695706.1 hypothetical protein [Bradyrhizobium lablabi]
MSLISTKSNASAKTSHHKTSRYLSDFTTDPRVVVISAIALPPAPA